jgi:hypothetical protein
MSESAHRDGYFVMMADASSRSMDDAKKTASQWAGNNLAIANSLLLNVDWEK